MGSGYGGPGYKFADEIAANRGFDRPFILAMANSGPNTNGSQFFITLTPQERLTGQYSIFGEVVSGQEVVKAISEVPRNADDKPKTLVKIIRIVVRSVRAKIDTSATSKPSPGK